MAEAGGSAAATPPEKDQEQEEERPDWLPEGWTMITKARNNGRVDRYYKSLLTGQMLRSKAKVILHANKHMPSDVELQVRSTFCLDDKQYSESNKLQDIDEAHFTVPDGWIVETKFRKGGIHPGASYKTYLNPVTGFKCYSLKDVFRYVTGTEPRRGTKKRAALSSPDSVLTQIDGSLKQQPFGLGNASRLKKNKIPTTATAQHLSTVRRSLFGSPMLSFNGIAELSLEDPFFQNYNMDSNQCIDASEPFHLRSIDACNIGSGNIWAGKVNGIFEGQPYLQNVFPEHCREETGKICNSIDELIRNLSHDFKIPDINIAYAAYIEQEMFNQASNIGAGINTRPTVGEPADQLAVGYPKKSEDVKVFGRLSESSHCMQSDALGIKPDCLLLREPGQTARGGLSFEDTSSTDGLPRKPCEQMGQDSVGTNKKDELNGNSCGGYGLPRKPRVQMALDSVATNKRDELKGNSCSGAGVTVNETSADMVPGERDELSKGNGNSCGGYGLPRKPHEQMGQDSVATNKNDELKGNSCSGAVVTVNETSADMVPGERDELSKVGLPVSADDNSDTISSRHGCKVVQSKQSESVNLKPASPRENRGTETSEQMDTKLKRAKEDYPVESIGAPSTRDRKQRYKMATITLPSRTSRRLAGLDAGPNADVDINEHALRRKKRLAKEKETAVEPNTENLSNAAEEECMVSQCPDNTSTFKASISAPSDAKNKQIPDQDPIIVGEDPMITEQPVPPSTGEDAISIEQHVPPSTREDAIMTEQPLPPSTTEDPIATEQPVMPSTEPGGENPKPACAKTSLFREAFLDPCLQFAVKTLTGDLPLFDGLAATGGGLFHQQTCPVNNSSSTGRRKNYPSSAHHAPPNGYVHHSNDNGFSQPYTPFPSDRVLNLNFATGMITRLSPFKHEFHSDAQAQGKGHKRTR